MKVSHVFLPALILTTLTVGTLASATEDYTGVTGVDIVLNDFTDIPYDDDFQLGLIYGGDVADSNAYIEILCADKEHMARGSCVLERIGVNVSNVAVGLLVKLGNKFNRRIRLMNYQGKTVEDLFGTYYGARIGIAPLIAGFEFTLAANANGVVLGDKSLYGGAVAAELSVPMFTILKRSSDGEEAALLLP